MITETRIEYIYPTAGLLVACSPAYVKDELKIQDVYDNRDSYEAAYSSCAARMKKIIDWYKDSRSRQQE